MKRSELSSPTREICLAYVNKLEEILGTNLYGVYLYGATVFPDAGPVQDIDCHVILREPFSGREREKIFQLYKELSNQFPPNSGELLDAYFILYKDAQQASPPTHQLRPEIRDEAWALHCTHVRAGYYITLYGPDPTEIFPPVSWSDISAALEQEIGYIEENLKYPAYCILNLCRIVYSFQQRDVVVSKRFSGRWACRLFPQWASLIQAAMKSYDGTATSEDDKLLETEVEHFLEFASERIREIRMEHHGSQIEIRVGHDLSFDQLLALYESLGWIAYTHEQRRAQLPDAIRNSTYVVSAWQGERLIGLTRGLSDDVSIFYLQDILIHPDFQRQGIGKRLLGNCLERFKHVRSKVLLTDDEERQAQFYESLGYKDTRKLNKLQLHTFVQIDGIDLE